MYQDNTKNYIYAHQLATEMLARKEIISFHCSYSRDRGRMIHVETDQGWNPEPFFEDFPESVSEIFYS